MTLEEFEKKANSFMNKRGISNKSNTEIIDDVKTFEKRANEFLSKRNSPAPQKIEPQAPQIKASDVRKVDIRDFDLMSGTTGKKIKLDSQIETLSKQIQQKENDYVRANNISDWDKKTQTKTEIGKELNELKSKLSSAQTSRKQ